jgi:hypothetical protein
MVLWESLTGILLRVRTNVYLSWLCGCTTLTVINTEKQVFFLGAVYIKGMCHHIVRRERIFSVATVLVICKTLKWVSVSQTERSYAMLSKPSLLSGRCSLVLWVSFVFKKSSGWTPTFLWRMCYHSFSCDFLYSILKCNRERDNYPRNEKLHSRHSSTYYQCDQINEDMINRKIWKEYSWEI